MASAAGAPLKLAYRYARLKGSMAELRDQEAALVLIHGLTSAAATFENVMDRLAERSHVFAVDLRGHGGSPAGYNDSVTSEHPASGATILSNFQIPLLATDVGNFIRSVVFEEHGVAKGLGHVHVLGHSWGARVACSLADLPSTRALVASLIIEDEIMGPVKIRSTALDDAAKVKVAIERALSMWQPTFSSVESAVQFCAQTMHTDPANALATYARKVVPTPGSEGRFTVLFKPHHALAWDFHASNYDANHVWQSAPVPIVVIGADDESADVTKEHRAALSEEAHYICEKALSRSPPLTPAADTPLPSVYHRHVTYIPESSHPIHRTHPDQFVACVHKHLFEVTAALNVNQVRRSAPGSRSGSRPATRPATPHR